MPSTNRLSLLQGAILASLPRPRAGREHHEDGEYLTAAGLKMDPDGHPLIRQATIGTIRAALGHLNHLGLVEKAPRSCAARRRRDPNSYRFGGPNLPAPAPASDH